MKKVFNTRLLALLMCTCIVAFALPFNAFATNSDNKDKSEEKQQISIGENYSKVYDGKEVTTSDVFALVSGKSGGVTSFTFEWYDTSGNKLSYLPCSAGKYVLEIVVSDKDPNFKGSARITYTIDQRPLEWDVSRLKVTKPQDGTAAAAKVSGTLGVKGVVEGDDAALVYDGVTAADFPTADVQRVSLPLTVANASITGEDSGNYSLPKLSPVAEAAIVKATVKDIAFEGDSSKYRLVVEEAVYVTKDLENTPYNTENAIKIILRDKVKEHFADKEEVNTVFYLPYIQVLKGDEWVKVEKDQLPQQDITVTLPYPDETKKSSHEFVVYQFASQGEKAGTIELITHKELADGIEVSLGGEAIMAVGSTPQKSNTTMLIVIGAIAVMVVAGTVFVKLNKAEKEEAEAETEQTEE